MVMAWVGATVYFWPLLLPFSPMVIFMVVLLPCAMIYLPSYILDKLEVKVDASFFAEEDHDTTAVPQSLTVKATLLQILCSLVFIANFGMFYDGAAWVNAAKAFIRIFTDLSLDLRLTFAWPDMPEFSMQIFLVFYYFYINES